MSYRLTDDELEIIEKTKQEGEQHRKKEKSEEDVIVNSGEIIKRKKNKGWKKPILSIVIFAFVFLLLAIVMRLFFDILTPR